MKGMGRKEGQREREREEMMLEVEEKSMEKMRSVWRCYWMKRRMKEIQERKGYSKVSLRRGKLSRKH